MASVMSPAGILNQHSSVGFYKAPLCKGLLGAMLLGHTAMNVPMLAHLRQCLFCEIPRCLEPRGAWKILLNRFTYIYPKDLVFTAIIIYCFRIFERRMGTRKFASFILCSATLSTLIEMTTITFLHQYEFPSFQPPLLHPGMYAIIFPLYVKFWLDVPESSGSNFFGVSVNSKTIKYLIGLQVAATSINSVVAATSGIIAGILYRLNFLYVKKWFVVPNAVSNCCDKLFGWILNSSAPKIPPMGATIELQHQEQADLLEQQYILSRSQQSRQARGQGYAERLVDDNRDSGLSGYFFRRRNGNLENEPSPENIRILVDMGFEASRAAEALRSSSNDLETATSILLRQ